MVSPERIAAAKRAELASRIEGGTAMIAGIPVVVALTALMFIDKNFANFSTVVATNAVTYGFGLPLFARASANDERAKALRNPDIPDREVGSFNKGKKIGLYRSRRSKALHDLIVG